MTDIISCFEGYKFIIKVKSNGVYIPSTFLSSSIFSGVVLCLCDIEKKIYEASNINYIYIFEDRVSYFIKIISGRACKSIFEDFVIWGKTSFYENAKDEYAASLDIDIHPIFLKLKSISIIVDDQSSAFSDDLGHKLMNNNPYKHAKISQSKVHLGLLLEALISGDFETFININEQESMALHAMLMTSYPNFLLLKPNTIKIINSIKNFRLKTGLPICYNLDADSNVNLIFPEDISDEVESFLNNYISIFCLEEKLIFSTLGTKPQKIGEYILSN